MKKIKEGNLIDLLELQIYVEALDMAGVDNWCGFGECFNDIKEIYCNKYNIKINKDDEYPSFRDIAKVIANKDYEDIKNDD